MDKAPKGAISSPYCRSEDGEPSVASLMGDAFDRLHENSWDGGAKKKKAQELQEKAKIAQEKSVDEHNKMVDKLMEEKGQPKEDIDPEAVEENEEEISELDELPKKTKKAKAPKKEAKVEKEVEKEVVEEVVEETVEEPAKEETEIVVEEAPEEVVAEAVKSNKKFTPALKKEMIQIILSNSLELGEVTGERITFKYKGSELVILPL